MTAKNGPAPIGLVALESKLHAPASRKGWVRRKDLIAQLVESADKKLTLVEAPVGYGKTILLAQWCSDPSEPRSFAWLTLDDSENDPIRLWTYIAEALRLSDTGIGDEAAKLVAQHGDHLNEIVVPAIVNELAVLPHKLVMVLDDYHHIKDARCHSSIELLVDLLPPTTQVVIATRSDPPIRLARTASADVFTVRTSQLRFDEDEARRLLEVHTDTRLNHDLLEQLLDRTEGWPAGLYLAALSLEGRSDPAGFIDAFAGDNRLVVDYLTVEVLNKQSDEERRFLTRTSILDRFTASACDAVVGAAGSEEMLARFEHSNLFVIPLEGQPRWFRYHRLFQDLLRSELQRAEPELIPTLHRRASEWHRKWGSLVEAIAHAISAQDTRAVRELIGSSWWSYWEAGRLEDVRSWLAHLGWEKVATDPPLSLIAAWTAGLTGKPRELEEWLVSAQRGTVDGRLADGTASLGSGIALVRALFASTGVERSLAEARRAASFEARPDARWRPLALTSLGFYLFLSGDDRGAEGPLTEVAGMRGASRFADFALGQLSMIAGEQGDSTKRAALARDARSLVDDTGHRDHPITATALAAWGAVLSETDPSDGVAELERALELARRSPWWQPWVTLQILIALAAELSRAGNETQALARLQEAKEMLGRHPEAGIISDGVKRLEAMLDPDGASIEASLTARERDVLALLPTPLTQREIGAELYLSINTVKSYTRSIFRKLGVESRPQAVAKAQRLGLTRNGRS